MSKHDRIEQFLHDLLPAGSDPAADPCWSAYFICFNSQQYYEAHDALEHRWLQLPRDHPDHLFFKALIQLAGAFVHLRLQFLEPGHRVHGRRLRPASRLFALALRNLAPSGPVRHGLALEPVRDLIEQHLRALEASAFLLNPWSPATAPRLTID